MGTVQVPGSKSHTIRSLFISAAARGESTLTGALDSEDSEAAIRVLRLLGTEIEFTDGSWQVSGTDGRFQPPSGTLDVGESGLTARHLIATSALVPGLCEIVGRGRLPERPVRSVIDAVAAQGAEVSSDYPWKIIGRGWIPGGAIEIDASESSQMLSAILATAPLAQTETTVLPRELEGSTGYVAMTIRVMTHFGATVHMDGPRYVIAPTGYVAASYVVPPDASSAVYPLVAAAITGSAVTVSGNFTGQPDHHVVEALAAMGCDVTVASTFTRLQGPPNLTGLDVDMSKSPDAAVAVAVACAVAEGKSRISGLRSLRLKESDRLGALETELTKFGAVVETDADSITIIPGVARPGSFETHNDHRIAMSLALLGLIHESIEINDPHVVNKTWPEFWEWLENSGASVNK